MIIFTTVKDMQVAIRPHSIHAVEQHPDDPAVSAITYSLTNRKKTNILFVKHTVQEVVDAINKVSGIWN